MYSSSYIGQAKRYFKTRVEEHTRDKLKPQINGSSSHETLHNTFDRKFDFKIKRLLGKGEINVDKKH